MKLLRAAPLEMSKSTTHVVLSAGNKKAAPSAETVSFHVVKEDEAVQKLNIEETKRQKIYPVSVVRCRSARSSKGPMNKKEAAEAYRLAIAQRMLDLFEAAKGYPARTVEELTVWVGSPEGKAVIAINADPETGFIDPYG